MHHLGDFYTLYHNDKQSPGTTCQTSLPHNGNSVMFSGVIDNVVAVAEEEEGDHTKIMENLMDSGLCRKEKRKMAKKMKRKQIRKEIAEKEREEEESRLNDLEEQHRLKLKEQEEADIMERQRKEFEERERLWMEKAAKLAEEEAQRKLQVEEEKAQRKQIENENDLDEDDTWEYLEDGPAEIIWQGNEIIVKKKRVRVAKKNADEQPCIEDADRPTSNPLPPQSEAFATYKNTPAVSTQQVFDSVAQQIPNFGTEQDKDHCPFHIKTGACRFGSRCSRVHFYPDKSCTMLIKNMYNGPGLAWEQDEGLEHTDEEVERCYEEFYEDVHTEFLKFGEIVNFKVCRNGSFHLRGNVYVHYKSLESAVLAYQSLNGRYFAGKQITCEFVGVTRWKVAICGEYMKSRLKTCSRGTACNFIHCFRNPGGDYEWADWDNPPPKYWIEKMVALFGPSDVSEYDKNMGTHSRRKLKNNKITSKFSRYPSRRSRSRSSVVDCLTSSSGGDHSDENRNHQHSHSSIRKCSSSTCRKKRSLLDEQQRNEENSSSEDDRYRYNEKDIAVHSHGDRDRISSSSRATSSRWRKGMDYLDGHDNLKERHKSHKSRLYSHDSSRKYSSRREHSSEQIKEGNYEHMKQDENYLADSHGRYDPNSGQNSDIEQRDNSETNSYFSEHEKYRGTSPDDRKPHERFKSQVEISDMNYSKKRSRHSMRKNHRKHSNSREEKADSSDKDQSCEEKHQSSSGNVVSHDLSRKGKNILNTERTSSKTTKGGLNLEKTGEHLRNMVESPEDIHHSRRHDRSSRRERGHREKAINRDDKTSISGVNDLELRGSRKRSRSQSPIQSSSRSKREISHGSHGS